MSEETIETYTNRIAEARDNEARAYYYFARGCLYAKSGHLDLGISDMELAMSLGYPVDSGAESLAKAYWDAGLFDKMVRYCNDTMKQMTDDNRRGRLLRNLVWDHVRRAVLAFQEGDPRAGYAACAEALAKANGIGHGYHLFCSTERNDALDLLLETLRLLTDELPTPPEGYLSLTDRCLPQGLDILQVLRSFPPDDQYYIRTKALEAGVLYWRGDCSAACAAVENLFRNLVQQPDQKGNEVGELAFHFLGLFLRRISDRDRWYDDPLYNLAEGWWELRKSRAWLAVSCFDRALSANADFPGAQKGLAEALHRVPTEIEGLLRNGDFWRVADLAARLPASYESASWLQAAGEGLQAQEQEEGAAKAFLLAAEQFEQVGSGGAATECLKRLYVLRPQARLRISVDIPESFILGDWDIISVTVENIGTEPAKSVAVAIEGPFTAAGTATVNEIRPGASSSVEISIRPDNAGRGVPLAIRVAYCDNRGSQTCPTITRGVRVVRPESPNGGL